MASRSRKPSSRNKSVGIIGGTGKMGRLFAGVFQRAGHDVLVAGRSTEVTVQDIARECGTVIVSVPIRDTVKVIESFSPLLTEDQLLCDLTSLKARPVAAMLRSKAEVIGLHPMFGPTVKTLRKQTIIACPARADEATVSRLLDIFRAEGAVCTITAPDVHDRMMAVVQGLTHFVTLCMADSVRRMGISIKDSKAFMSPVYQIELSLVGRLLSQDPDLYGSILEENPFVPEVLAACRDSVDDLQRVVIRRDPEAFREFFMRDARHFGSYCAEGLATTDALIEGLVK